MKDSGARAQFDSGMVRDVEDDKTDYSLILDGPMFDRWAEHLTKGAKKYAPRNWMKASGDAELQRFKRSALRHFLQWYRGEADEDHAAATIFNINGAEYVKDRFDPIATDEEIAAVTGGFDIRVGDYVRVKPDLNVRMIDEKLRGRYGQVKFISGDEIEVDIDGHGFALFAPTEVLVAGRR